MMSGASAHDIDVLTRYGEAIGIAFQLADDIVDITSDSSISGKTPGTDLREGVPTLAGLIALAGDDAESARLRALLARPLPDDAEHAEALALLRNHQALVAAQQEAVRWSGIARSQLDSLPDTPARKAMESLCDYVVNRSG